MASSTVALKKMNPSARRAARSYAAALAPPIQIGMDRAGFGTSAALSMRSKRPDKSTTDLVRAAVGRAAGDALSAMAHAYRAWALQHPGRYASAQRAPVPGDTDDEAASARVVQVAMDVMAGFELRDDDAVDAIRALRAALHGFVALETAGGFGLPVSIDRSFDRLVAGLETAFTTWRRPSRSPALHR